MSIQCLKCGYSITEPICASCVINEVKYWLHEQPLKKESVKEIESRLKSLIKDIESSDYLILPSQNQGRSSAMNCIKCGKDMYAMCFYCVSNEVSQIVHKNLRNKVSKENFGELFNTGVYDYGLNKM